MNDTSKAINNDTDIEVPNTNYHHAKAERTTIAASTWQFSAKVQSASTSRTSGEIKMRIAPREMPEPKRRDSTR